MYYFSLVFSKTVKTVVFDISEVHNQTIPYLLFAEKGLKLVYFKIIRIVNNSDNDMFIVIDVSVW